MAKTWRAKNCLIHSIGSKSLSLQPLFMIISFVIKVLAVYANLINDQILAYFSSFGRIYERDKRPELKIFKERKITLWRK